MRRESAVDLTVERSALSLDAPLGNDRMSGWRWSLGAGRIGTYRQHDSAGVRCAIEGRPWVAEGST